ncbi:unnamed protein product [Camellia sinensis]
MANLSSLVHQLRERIAASSSTPPNIGDDDALEIRFRAVLPNLLHAYVVPSSSANEREVITVLKPLTHTAKNFPGVFFHGRATAVLPLIGRILPFFVEPAFRFIYLEDVLRIMLEDEALKTMSLLRGSPESEKISQSSLKNWVVNAFRERRALALTLNDTKTAVNKLHHMVNVLVVIVIAVVSLFILGIATSRFLFLISSQIVVVAFIFGNSCKTVFEAIVFLFVMHPYDVGDQCEIDGVQMVVEEMNILTAVFLRLDNQKIKYPNSILSTKPISNYYRSPDMGDSIDFCVHIATPIEKIAIIRQRIISYVESKKDHWYPSLLVVPMDLVGLNDLKLSVWLTHRMNHQDMGKKWLRRAFVTKEMIKIFKELDMEYCLLPLDINIRNMPPISSTCCPNHHDHYEVEHDRI